MIFGTGFAPHRGGPIQTIRERGKDRVARDPRGAESASTGCASSPTPGGKTYEPQMNTDEHR